MFVDGKLMATTCFFALCLIFFSCTNQGSPILKYSVLNAIVSDEPVFFQRCQYSPKTAGGVLLLVQWLKTAGWCQETLPFHSFSDFQELSFLWLSLEKKNKRKTKQTKTRGCRDLMLGDITVNQRKTPVLNVCIYRYKT